MSGDGADRATSRALTTPDEIVTAALEIIDSFGQKSLLRFNGFAANAPVSADAFQFKVPPGADVIEQ